jgi:hypothetical protein
MSSSATTPAFSALSPVDLDRSGKAMKTSLRGGRQCGALETLMAYRKAAIPRHSPQGRCRQRSRSLHRGSAGCRPTLADRTIRTAAVPRVRKDSRRPSGDRSLCGRREPCAWKCRARMRPAQLADPAAGARAPYVPERQAVRVDQERTHLVDGRRARRGAQVGCSPRARPVGAWRRRRHNILSELK